MRYGLPLVALMLAIALGLAGPGTARPAPLRLAVPSLAQVFAPGAGCEAASQPRRKPATLFAASLRGWAEGPTAQGVMPLGVV